MLALVRFVLSSHSNWYCMYVCLVSAGNYLPGEYGAHTRSQNYCVPHQTTVLPCMESTGVGEIIGR